MFVDSHCHLNHEQLILNMDSYLTQMKQAEVDYALCVATKLENLTSTVELAQNYQQLFATVGIHPDEAIGDEKNYGSLLTTLSNNDKVIAIGETGLDYYRNQGAAVNYQQQRFIDHITVAKNTNLPLIIHTRNSIAETLKLIKSNDAKQGVMHCFSEDLTQAFKCIDLGFYISISGIVTFKNAALTQEVAKKIPLEWMLIETDAPYLAPVPFRGKLNHPALVSHTAKFIAELRGITVEELAYITTNNFFKLFTKASKN